MESSLIVSLVALAGVLGQAIKALVGRHRGNDSEALKRDIDLISGRLLKLETRLEVHLNGRHTGTG